ncbi:MAG TPA: DUF2934 domain-containing protein [Kofleriaceae bacterium]|jgi:hypothetical protein
MAASIMAKKKTPSTSRLSAKKTDAPMMITRAVEEPAPPVEPMAIERTEIARLAYAKFVARGYMHGHAVADWLSAESELRAKN